MPTIRGAAANAALGGASLLFALLLIEMGYRWQIVDTYADQLRSENPPEELSSRDRPAILAMGDSFTAGPWSYPAVLRVLQNDYRVISAGIPGTGVLQASFIARRRFDEFDPEIFIYQIYLGNDLFDIRYPINFSALSLPRNFYWLASQNLRVFPLLNQRLGNHYFRRSANRSDSDGANLDIDDRAHHPREDEPFSPDLYQFRDRLTVKAEPGIFEDQILIRGRRADDFAVFLSYLEDLLAYCEPSTCTAYVLLVPHVSQLGGSRLDQMRALGARFDEPDAVTADDYAFKTGTLRHLGRLGLSNVRVLDPLSTLRGEETARRPVFFPNDPHLNPHGQEILARFVWDQLRAAP